MPELKAVIFDVDGTLVDSVDLHATAWVETLAEYGFEIAFSAMRHEIGKGGDELMKVFLPKQQLAELGPEIEKRRGEIFQKKYLSSVQAFPKTRELFEKLRSDGKKIVLASSAAGEELKTYKKAADIEDLIESETSKDDVEKSKPHPDIFEAALDKLRGIEAGEAVVIGDTPWDVIAANKVGIRSLGVLCGGFPEEELLAAGCSGIFLSPADLLEHYNEAFS